MKKLFSRFALFFFLFSVTTLFTTSVLAADAATPIKIETTLTDKVSGDEAVGEKDAFTKDTPMIYLVCTSDEVKKGQSVKAVWIADDTHNAAPANYKIDEKAMSIDEDLGDNDQWTAKYSLSKPNAGWPLGQYHVDLYVDDKLVKTVKFTIGDKEE